MVVVLTWFIRVAFGPPFFFICEGKFAFDNLPHSFVRVIALVGDIGTQLRASEVLSMMVEIEKEGVDFTSWHSSIN